MSIAHIVQGDTILSGMNMNEVRFEALTEGDTAPFLHNETAVRLFTENSGWFVGILQRINIDNDCCRLGIDPFVRFGHKSPVDPKDPGETLVTKNDRPIKGSLRNDQLPFSLENPQKLVQTDDDENNTLVIGFKGGAAILSRRPQDIEEVHKIIDLLESLGS